MFMITVIITYIDLYLGFIMFVCICNGITDSDIRQAMDDGASTVRDLNRTMGVGSCCGKCTRVARDVLKSHSENNEIDNLAYEIA